jgi:hypothetical protein
MATNVTVRDLNNYPGVSKTVTVDQTTLVPVGYDGDEQWVLTFRTSAYSDNTARTPIQDIFIREVKCGWLKSSGLVDLTNYITASGSQSIKVKMDNSSKYYTITLAVGTAGVNSLADSLEDAIHNVPDDVSWDEDDDELAYKNAMVEFQDGKFYILSGTFSKHYTGATRSSVKVDEVAADTMYYDLGFNLSTDSESIASTGVYEALLSSDYTAGDASLYVVNATGFVVGKCALVTDGVNTDQFTILAVSGTKITVPTVGVNGFDGIANSYSTGLAKVQILNYQNPDSFPVPYHRTVDSIIKWGVNSIINQIDFSS